MGGGGGRGGNDPGGHEGQGGRLRPRRHRACDLLHAGEPLLRPLLRRLQGRARLRRSPEGLLGAFAQAWPGGASEHLLPFHLEADSGIGECTHDLNHTWPAEHLSRGAGNNADFVKTHTSAAFEGPQNGVLTMGYYERGRPSLLLRVGRRLHHLRQLPLLGHGPHASQPAHGAFGDHRSRQGKPGGPSSSPTRTSTPSGAQAGPPCPRCSKTPASAGRSTTPRARSYAPAFFEQTRTPGR